MLVKIKTVRSKEGAKWYISQEKGRQDKKGGMFSTFERSNRETRFWNLDMYIKANRVSRLCCFECACGTFLILLTKIEWIATEKEIELWADKLLTNIP